MEEEVLHFMHFKSHTYDSNLSELKLDTTFDRTLDLSTPEQLHDFVSRELMTRPVLVYTDGAFYDYLREQVDFKIIVGEDTHFNDLRRLDATGPDGRHRLVLTN